MKKDVILGIHGFSYGHPRQMHDAGVCIVSDGKVLAAIDEERLTRAKRDGRFPINAYYATLKESGISPDEITGVAFSDRRSLWQTYWIWRYAFETFVQTGVKPMRYLSWWNHNMVQFSRKPPPDIKSKKVRFYEHHLCHAASAYYSSPWDKATVVTLDGMGDFSIGGSVYSGNNGHLKLVHRSNGYFSPGHFYMIVTEYLGFTPGRHEGKVTGLAGHGNPEKAYRTMEKIIRYRNGKLEFVAGPVAEEFFNVIRSKPGTRTREWYSQNKWVSDETGSQHVPERYSGENLNFFRKLWKDYSMEDIAAAAQKRLEDVVSAYVKDAFKMVGEPQLVVAGGTFANVQVNKKLMEMPETSNIYIHPNMGDGGLSLGAAMLMHHELRETSGIGYTQEPLDHVYLGSSYSEEVIEKELREFNCKFSKPLNISEVAAKALAANKIVAVFQGKMEYGPRALGNRSLLVSATDKKTHHDLNTRLNRSEIMPFAPIIMEEYAPIWLDNWDVNQIASRFMTITYDMNKKLSLKVPATVHVDGTVRPQVIGRDDNSLVHEILTYYNDLTGIPLVINTSFNMHEEPIVCSPRDAIETFKRGAADLMLIGPYLVVP